MRIHDQVAIVTGASRGIGAACAKTLAREGAHVVLVDLLPSEETKQEIAQINPNVKTLSFEVDIRNKEAIQDLVKQTHEEFGRIDILVNNAGTASRLDLEEMTEEMWDRDIETNLKATFFLTQAVIYPYMKEQQYGRVVNISSISGIIGGHLSGFEPGSTKGRSGPAYAASKGGVIAFTKWVAKEVGSLGIAVNSVAPGGVETAITKGMAYNVDNQSIKRMGTTEEIAEAVLYFASKESAYTTGQVLKVCGGAAIG
ncbi:SDR family oxidoreductase [Psychrobacillus sp. NEAU-3TGS]|uniref:SDR family NAD(P)-dependent oxidoreductase n=1 Tax=Psychrobacillus sp. NEAU-3TGS TaxID=2995412 RepID=UPI002498441E|nr:SDR family oxidoreductase [Psychrobacillus sp. NEAU-3TGS]MDI2589743.1 SDR family oxidoreductase [Psychrobacillus sp. NEAU-3TGS]